MKVACRGANLWVWAGDLDAPAITEFDDQCGAGGYVGFKSEGGRASISKVRG